jgi:hypothetical protein
MFRYFRMFRILSSDSNTANTVECGATEKQNGGTEPVSIDRTSVETGSLPPWTFSIELITDCYRSGRAFV